MKKIVFLLGVLLSLGRFCACSSDDEFGDLMDKKLSLFEDSLQSVSEWDYTDRICVLNYDRIVNAYTITYKDSDGHPKEIFFPINLPEEYKEPLDKGDVVICVTFSGKVVEMNNKDIKANHVTLLEGCKYYYVYLTKINDCGMIISCKGLTD